MSDDTPTQRFDAPAPRAGGDAAEPEKNTSRRLIIALIGVGAVILIALIVVLIVLLVGNGKPAALATTTPSPSVTISDTPIASSAPSTPPTPTTTPTVAPPPSGPDLISFTTGTPTVQCDSRTGNPIPLSFRWAGTGGSVVFIAVGATDDPKANGQGWELPTIGTQADFPDELDYSCYSATATYSLGIYDANGHKSVKRITIKNTGEVR